MAPRYDTIQKPPPKDDEHGWYRWYYKVCEVLNKFAAMFYWVNSDGTVNYIPMDTTPTDVPAGAGVLAWNTVDGCMNIQQLNSTTLQVGQELFFYGKASGAVSNGDLCQFAGVQGDHILIKKAVASEIKANPSYLIGVATQNIANGEYGYVTWFGKVNGVYTDTPANNDSADWADGDLLYFNNSTGYLTKTKPDAPNILITVAAVIKVQTGSSENGIILVRPTFTGTFTELNDVDGAATADGQFYLWDNTNKFFEPTANVTINDTTPTISTNTNDLVISCGTEKTLRLEEPVWKDIDFPIIIRTTGVGIPTLTTVLGNLTMPQWAISDFNMCEIQEIVHEWEQGTSINWHIHIVTAVQDATDRYLNWEVEFNYANIYVPSVGMAYSADMSWQGTNTVVTSGNSIIPANTPIRTNIIIPINTWAYTAGKIGAHVSARLRRIAVTGGVAEPTVAPFCGMLQMHVLCDTMGSRLIGTK